MQCSFKYSLVHKNYLHKSCCLTPLVLSILGLVVAEGALRHRDRAVGVRLLHTRVDPLRFYNKIGALIKSRGPL
jgi:hypothetical protein